MSARNASAQKYCMRDVAGLPRERLMFETRNPSPQNLYEVHYAVHHPQPRRSIAYEGTHLVVTEDPPEAGPHRHGSLPDGAWSTCGTR